MPDLTVLGVLELMDPKDIAPIFEEMTGGKEATEESRVLAGALVENLRRLVVEEKAGDVANNGG
jgi:small neutral amino acid transporter SnatA (MarC family)